jgi:hypothetical protein
MRTPRRVRIDKERAGRMLAGLHLNHVASRPKPLSALFETVD